MLMLRKAKDSQLVGQVLSGDVAAFGTLVERYSSAVFGVAVAHLRNRTDAEDVAQDVFLSAFKSLGTLQERPKFGHWLMALARNRCQNVLRRRRLEAALPERLNVMQEAARPQPDREELHRLLHEEIQALDEGAREVLMLHYFSRMKTRAIAQLLGISKSAAAKRLQRARTALGERLVDVIGEEFGRTDKPKERAARIMGTIAAAMPGWKASGVAGTGAAAVESSVVTGLLPAAKVIGGILLMKKAVIGAALVLAALLAFWALLEREPNKKTFEPEDAPTAVASADNVGAGTEERLNVLPQQESTSSDLNTADVAGVAPLPTEEEPDPYAIADPAQYCSISGNVVDPAGVPIAGAEVLVVAVCMGEIHRIEDFFQFWKGFGDKSHRFRALTDASGAYGISGISFRGLVHVSAFTGQYAAEHARQVVLADGDSLESVDLVLRLGEVTTGFVLTAEGQPVADAVVEDAYPGDGVVAYTDKDGWFAGVLDVRNLTVYSPTYGFASFLDPPVHENGLVELRMPGMAVLKGRVTRADQSPATGFQVRLLGARDAYGTTRLNYRRSIQVDGNGAYEIGEIDVGLRYEVSVHDPSDARYAVADLGYLEPNKETVWDCEIQSPIVVHGHVRSLETREPIRLAGIVTVWAVSDGSKVTEENKGMIREDGTYALNIATGAGKYLICPAYFPFAFNGFEAFGKEVYLTSGEVTELDLFVPGPYTASVRAVDANGAPVSGAVVQERGPGIQWPLGVTDENGRFQYSGFTPVMGLELPEDSWFIISCPGFADEEGTHYRGHPGEVFPEETVVLYRAGGLAGRAVDSDGNSFSDVKLSIGMNYGEGKARELSLSTNADGYFTGDNCVPATEVTFDIKLRYADGDETRIYTWRSDPTQCVPGQTTDLGEIVFERSNDS